MIGEEKGSVAISGRSSHKMTGLQWERDIKRKRRRISEENRKQEWNKLPRHDQASQSYKKSEGGKKLKLWFKLMINILAISKQFCWLFFLSWAKKNSNSFSQLVLLITSTTCCRLLCVLKVSNLPIALRCKKFRLSPCHIFASTINYGFHFGNIDAWICIGIFRYFCYQERR